MPELSFEARFALLVALLVVAASIDKARHGKAATRWREYLLLLAFGAIGALVGLGVDQVTSRLSPDYFELGKGLDRGPGFALAVVRLSLEAGLSAGLILGALLLLANSGAGGLAPRALLSLAAWPVALGLGLSPPGAVLAMTLDPRFVDGPDLRTVLPDPDLRASFVLVWGAHAGLYAGGLAGTIAAVVRVRRAMRQRDPEAGGHSGS